MEKKCDYVTNPQVLVFQADDIFQVTNRKAMKKRNITRIYSDFVWYFASNTSKQLVSLYMYISI